jgi:D-arabinose 1-dehydrogenase-like Zn-dependent alcohol dehydrogenase
MAELARDGALQVDVEEIPLRQIKAAWDKQKSGVDRRIVVIP